MKAFSKLAGIVLSGLVAYGLTSEEAKAAEYVIRNRQTGLVLDVPRASRESGVRIIQWGYAGSRNQRWAIVPLGNGYVKIVSCCNGKVLDVPNGSRKQAVPVIQYAFHGGANQQWKIVPLNNGYVKIVNRWSGQVLDVPNGTRRPGVPIVQYAFHGGANQQWRLVLPASLPTDVSGIHPGQLVIDDAENQGGDLHQDHNKMRPEEIAAEVVRGLLKGRR